MADLMRETTSYQKLCKKYEQFAAPAVKVLVDGVDLLQKKEARISEVAVDLSCDGSASTARFIVIDEYDREKSAFAPGGAAQAMQLGVAVDIELGYSQTELVFSGLCVEIEYVFDDENNAPHVQVVCMDAACLLMRQQNLMLYSGKSVSDIVAGVFATKPFADYVKGTQVDKLPDKLDMVPSADESDFAVLCRFARRYGCEFFICQGKAYFRLVPARASTVLALTTENFLLTGARLALRSAGLTKKIVVTGVGAADGKAVSGEAALEGKFSSGPSAAKMLGQATKTLADPTVKDAGAAKKRADLLMAEARGSFGRLQCQCAGLPELVPGRNVEVKGFLPQADVTAYIQKVSHSFTDQGFYTKFEAKVEGYNV